MSVVPTIGPDGSVRELFFNNFPVIPSNKTTSLLVEDEGPITSPLLPTLPTSTKSVPSQPAISFFPEAIVRPVVAAPFKTTSESELFRTT